MARKATKTSHLTPIKRTGHAVAMVNRYKPHLTLFSGAVRLGAATSGGVREQDLKLLGIPYDEICFVLFEFDREEEGRLDIVGHYYPKTVRGKKLLLTQGGKYLLFSWSYDQRLQRHGKYVGDPHTVHQRNFVTSLRSPTLKELGEILVPERLLELESRFSSAALERLVEVETQLQMVKTVVQAI